MSEAISLEEQDYRHGFHWHAVEPVVLEPMPLGFAEGFDAWPHPRYDAYPRSESVLMYPRRLTAPDWEIDVGLVRAMFPKPKNLLEWIGLWGLAIAARENSHGWFLKDGKMVPRKPGAVKPAPKRKLTDAQREAIRRSAHMQKNERWKNGPPEGTTAARVYECLRAFGKGLTVPELSTLCSKPAPSIQNTLQALKSRGYATKLSKRRQSEQVSPMKNVGRGRQRRGKRMTTRKLNVWVAQ